MKYFPMFVLTILLALLGVELIHVYQHAVFVAQQTMLVPADLQLTQAGMALDLVSGFVTAPSTTLTAWTMASGDSLQIRNTSDPTKLIRIIQAWGTNQTAGYLGIRSPKMHDNVRGYRNRVTAANSIPLMPFGQGQRVYAQDVLIAEQSGSATGGDLEQGSMLVCYDDLPGVSARFISPDDLAKRGINVHSVENSIVSGAGGGYTGATAITVTQDLMKANVDYALVGYLVNSICHAVSWKGADTGNLRLGGPGNQTLRHMTAEWFKKLSEEFSAPLIPVFNAANKGNITVEVMTDENAGTFIVNSLFVELAPTGR